MFRWYRRWRRRREIRRLISSQSYDTFEQEEWDGNHFYLSFDEPIGTWLPQLETHLQERAADGVVW